jgi:hypothetical protein
MVCKNGVSRLLEGGGLNSDPGLDPHSSLAHKRTLII